MRASYLLTSTLVLGLAACGGRAAVEEPTPDPGPTPTPTTTPAPTPTTNTDDEERRRRAAEEEARRRREAELQALRADLGAVINFDYNKADVRGADQANLDRKAAILEANPNVRLRISGHADERGDDEYNLALGNRRAAAAKRYLTTKGIADARLDVISYGEERPVDPAQSEDAFARNRRDEFEIVAGADNLVAPR